MTDLTEPIFDILDAQAANLARITTGLTLDGTNPAGGQVTLWGPRCDLIRLYDTPIRLINDKALENWERMVVLRPLTNDEAARVTSRNDRDVQYRIDVAVRLLESEIKQDRLNVLDVDRRWTTNPLAIKAHKLLYDIHHIFHDNLLLTTDACPNGLVDHQSYAVRWVVDYDYPFSVFSLIATARRSGW